MPTFWLERLGCPKNDVDSDKLSALLRADGYDAGDSAEDADLIVVNTCAFIDEARQESIDTILRLSDQRRDGAELVVTGCLAERSGAELLDAMPEIDRVAGFGRSLIEAGSSTRRSIPVAAAHLPSFDLLNLPRPPSAAPWAYVKIAEGCDRACGFCAIPTFRGPQRSRSIEEIVTEVDQLGASEIVLVAQDLASYGRDQGRGERALIPLIDTITAMVDRVRLLYLYPSDLTDALIGSILSTGVPYFDLSLQHVSAPLLRSMRRWGDGARFLDRIEAIRQLEPGAVFRSNFIVGYPGETEADHDALLDFVDRAQLDWCGFFAYSKEEGTYAATLGDEVPAGLRDERLAELSERQGAITARHRDDLIGSSVEVLIDRPGEARSYREAPEIDGIVLVDRGLPAGLLTDVRIVGAEGPDLDARTGTR